MPLVDLVPLFAAFLAFLICYMLLVAYKATLGALLRTIANAINIHITGIGHPFAFIANGITALDSQINNALATAVTGTQWAWEKMINVSATLLHDSLKATAELAEGTERAFRHFATALVPGLIRAATTPLHKAIQSLDHQLGYLWRVAGGLAKEIEHAVAGEVPKTIIRVKRVVEPAVKAAVATVPKIKINVAGIEAEAAKVAYRDASHAIADVLPRVKPLERDLHGIDETLKDTLKKVTPAGIAGLLIGSVLAKIGMTWLRCSNVNRAARSICGLNPNTLEALLAGLVSIFGTIGLVTFAKQVQDVTADFATEVRHFWRADVAGSGGDRQLGSPTST